jgi:hypothetical protein
VSLSLSLSVSHSRVSPLFALRMITSHLHSPSPLSSFSLVVSSLIHTMGQQRIDSYFLRSSSSNSTASTVIDVNSDAPTDEEQEPARKRLCSRVTSSQLPIESFFVSPATRSSSTPITVDGGAQPVVRRAMSDITNVATSSASSSQSLRDARKYAKRRRFYREIRARLANPADNTKCKYCGMREHTCLHHEIDFRRRGTNIREPSSLHRAQLEAEVLRCIRPDGSVGLVAVCTQCHHEADCSGQSASPSSLQYHKHVRRNRDADNKAKISRGQCQCDGKCGHLVNADNVGQFEWDHLVQSFEDPEYCLVSDLVSTCCSLARCERERQKCRLLYIECHRRHSGQQARRAKQRRVRRRTSAV